MVTEKINEMIAKLQAIVNEAERLENKSIYAAGTKINKTMTELAKDCKAVKVSVSDIRTKIKEQRANK